MPWQIGIKLHFDSAHQLRNYEGKCARLHGHRWELELLVEASKLDSVGMAYDFTKLKQLIRKDLEIFDHGNLNQIPPFDNINPTAENIAKFFFERYAQMIANEKCSLKHVKIWETPTAFAIFSKE